MPRGGRRKGAVGKTYGNRTDLNGPKPPGMPLPVQAAPGQPYGARKQQEDAQRALPMASGQPLPSPTQVPSLADPTTRPSEPITAGLPMGLGAGPEALTGLGGDDLAVQLRAVYSAFPSEELREVLERMDAL